MSKEYEFRLNLPGLNELMKSAEMQSIIDSAASSIAGNAGEGFEAEAVHPIQFVAIASVRATTFKARLNNSKNNVLEKATRSVSI